MLVEKRFANIGAMQQQLYFPRSDSAQKELTIIHTPGLSVPGYPDNRVITVDLETYTTRIMGSDYFGEAKKGGLRMWNQWVCDAGGLGLHAGCKVYPDIHGEEKLVLIIGLSGTGKTTTVFRSQLGSLPVQDDFCAFMPGGLVRATENGCFAKTYQLDGKNEPVIFNALTQPESWLENVSVSGQGEIDFFDGSHTTNGRGTFRLDQINHRSPSNLPKVSSIIFLNRNFNIIPAVVKLNLEQAAAYFMLGETTGTSAGGSSEAGKFLRVPGTNPFFCQQDFIQGNRFYDLLKSNSDINVFLFNTGCVGGREESGQAKKVGSGTARPFWKRPCWVRSYGKRIPNSGMRSQSMFPALTMKICFSRNAYMQNKGVKLNTQPSLNRSIKIGQNISTSLTACTIK